ncbi:similar to Saccharomyces cerevisiae YOL044W PEX15 Phosphorylated tail-anchored type II integral peroxisomal membrane protein required for peroxisome biogenesis [Maudiozyma saulgeensis]|uniref:Similar to Saccharomyces cerevisiae YOL044W PEX15 Phosphorylated tail-anchored type II integral peroxisomal membrane protein required for peroxisome biogenesis n=1 Tax=Maudiozyma saulgeensis TaxID=1789683 RepID=A0A1X7R3K3_9SACH|nr:similar to Saccharomyces cerevisiae YOL044W PEX15 Phosphorylated tail-anchored type II integral peroxisomal membrane protein required for peroxisome biogenesis [Kazachstania saulgeensis]
MTDKFDSSSPSVSQEITPTGFSSDGEPLSESVRSLLNDNIFKENEQALSDKQKSYDRDRAYHKCLSLFIRGNIKECLESMAENNLLSEEFLNGNIEVYDLYLTASNEISDFQDLGVTLKNVVRDTFSGDMKSLKMIHHYTSDIEKEMEFWSKYFNNCIKTIRIRRNDNEFAISLQDELKQVLLKCTNKISKEEADEEVTIPTMLYLQKLVYLYIFELEIENLGSKPNVKLYHKLCSSIPHLSEILTNNITDGNDTSCEASILARLEPPPNKKKTISPPRETSRIRKHQNHESTDEDHNATSTRESSKTTENDDQLKHSTGFKTKMLTYIKSNKYVQRIVHNDRLNIIIDHILNIEAHPQTIILATVAAVIVLRYTHRRIRYIFRNFPALINKILPYFTEFISLLATT